MKSFDSLQSAIEFINGLNLPADQIEKIEQFPHVFRPYDVRLKWADCDIISVIPDYDPSRNYKQIYRVEKRYFSAPISLTEVLGMAEKRYKTPSF